MPKPADLLQGTLDLLILKTLTREPLHGWGIAKRIQLLSDEELSVGQGSLYPALHRLESQGWIAAQWKDSDLGRSAKFYSLTREGGNSSSASWKPGSVCHRLWDCCSNGPEARGHPVTPSRLFRIALQRLRALTRPRDIAREIDRELAWHLDLLVQEKLAAGSVARGRPP